MVDTVSNIKDRIGSLIRESRDREFKNTLRDLLQELDRPYDIEWMREQYKLSKTEFKVLSLLIEGNSAQMIADITGTQKSTIRVHLGKIYRKTSVSSMAELTALLLQQARNA
jgi:DNA-binding NarL/FixJ family response regulator